MAARKPNLEELLLVQAAEIIATQGLDALSLRELGRRVGVSRAAPYHYFADKAELVARVGALGFERLGARIDESVRVHDDPLRQLRAGLHAYVQFAQEEGNFFHLMFSGALRRDAAPEAGGAAGDPGTPWSSGAARSAFGRLVQGVHAAQQQGLLRPGDPLLVVNVLWAFTHGIAVLRRGDHLKHPLGSGAVFEAGLDTLLACYAPDRAAEPRTPAPP